MKRLIILITFLLLSAMRSAMAQETPELRATFPQYTLDSFDPSTSFFATDHVYFVADDGIHGKQLWKTDGTEGGTVMVKEIISQPNEIDIMGTVGNNVVLASYSFSTGIQYWATDGTAANTIEVTNPSLDSLTINGFPPINLTALGRTFFIQYNTTGGYALIESDGTLAGTKKIHSNVDRYFLTVVNDKLFYMNAGTGNIESYDLFIKTPVTPGGTLVSATSTHCFYMGSYETTTALFSTNGTLGNNTRLTDKIGYEKSVAFHDTLYVVLDYSGDRQIYRSDGTVAGTTLIQEGLKLITGAMVAGDKIMFIEDTNSIINLWIYDPSTGTMSTMPNFKGFPLYSGPESPLLFYQRANEFGSQLMALNVDTQVSSLVGEFSPSKGYLRPFIHFNNKVIFAVDDRFHGEEVWITDGTRAGTHLIKDINALPVSLEIGHLNTVGSGILMELRNSNYPGYADVWSYDPASESVDRLLVGGSLTNAVAVGGKLYFMDRGALWHSDGSISGTDSVTSGFKFPMSTNLFNTTSRLFITYYTPGGTLTCRVTNGTAAPTLIDNLSVPGIQNAVSAGSSIYFYDQTSLWKSDGTEEGTSKVKDLQGIQWPLFGFNDKVYFNVTNGENPQGSTWASDGTTLGTLKIQPGFSFQSTRDRVFYMGQTADNGFELWTTDGTTSGTKLYKDIIPGPEDSFPQVIGQVEDSLIVGVESDSTLFNIYDGGNSIGAIKKGVYYAGQSIIDDDGVYFLGIDASSQQYYLYFTDGSAAHTRSLDNILEAFGDRKFTTTDAAVFYVKNISDGVSGLWSLAKSNTPITGLKQDSKPVSFYPNPTRGELSIDCKESNFILSVTDLFGRELSHASNQKQIVLDLPQGLYIVRFTSNERAVSGKLIVIKD